MAVRPGQPLNETFQTETIDPRLQWFCPPPSTKSGGGELLVDTAANTDFWQRVHYGFRNDNGHFLHAPEVEGPFVMTTQVSFDAKNQYDQAGLYVRLGPDFWIKTSVEYEPAGPCWLGVVVTNNGLSDWSTQAMPPGVKELDLRIRREADGWAYIVEAKLPGGEWTQLRMTYMKEGYAGPVMAGLYACSPIAAGFSASFGHLSIEYPPAAPAH